MKSMDSNLCYFWTEPYHIITTEDLKVKRVKMRGSGKDRTLNHRDKYVDFEGLDTWLTQAKLAELALFHQGPLKTLVL